MFYRGRSELPGPYYTLRMPWGLVAPRGWECQGSPGSVRVGPGNQHPSHHPSLEQDSWGAWGQSQGMRQLLGLVCFPPSVASSCGFSPCMKYVAEVGNCPWCWIILTQRHFMFWRVPLVGTLFILSKQETTAMVILVMTTQTIISFKLYPVIFQVRGLIELFT